MLSIFQYLFIEDLSTRQIFTTEMLDGIPVDQCLDLDLEHREFIGGKIMELCLLEILKFRYMQTDPNWANFLYNPKKKQVRIKIIRTEHARVGRLSRENRKIVINDTPENIENYERKEKFYLQKFQEIERRI